MQNDEEGAPLEDKAGDQDKLSQSCSGGASGEVSGGTSNEVSLGTSGEVSRGTSNEVSRGNSYVMIAVCVVLSMIFMKTGILSFLFLVPLGYAILVSGSLWITFLTAAAANIVLSLFLHTHTADNSSLWMDIFYFTTILLMFCWIMGGRNLRTAYRFLIASAAGAAAFIILIMSNRNDSSFYMVLNEMSELLASVFLSSSANDAAVQQAFTPEKVLEMIRSISLRGGAMVSMIFIFFLNRQITLTAMWLVKKQRYKRSLTKFFAPPVTIWVLSGALAAVLLSSVFRIELLEILSWNVLTVCAILFTAQGAGIVLHLFTRFTPVTRIIVSVLVMVLILSPASVIAIAAVLLLGISETWLPIRVKKAGS